MYVALLTHHQSKSFLIRIVGAGDAAYYILSAQAKRCVFSFFLKLLTLSVFLTNSGKLFQIVSDAHEKDLEAKTDLNPLGLASSLCPSDRR